MLKILGVGLLVGLAFFLFNKETIENYKSRVIEAINPATKERRLIGELKQNLDELGLFLSSNPSANSKQNSQAATLLRQAQETISELNSTNQKIDLGASLSQLIRKLSPASESPSPTWLPPGQKCPITN